MLGYIKGLWSRMPLRGMHMPRWVRNIALSAGILVVLFFVAGVFYTWYTDQHQYTAAAPTSDTAAYTPITPKQPSPNAAEGVAVEMVTTPVSIGSEATVSIRTNPTSKCQIAVIYGYDPSKMQSPVTDPELGQQVADAYGSASWTWTVKPSSTLGTGNVTVTCTYHGRTGVVENELDVTQ